MRMVLWCWVLAGAAMAPAAMGQQQQNRLASGSLVTGALVDEASVKTTIEVDASGQVRGSVPTIQAGLRKSLDSLRRGVPTRVRIAPGTYREAAMDVRFDEAARDTLLVLEGRGDVVWSGADLLPSAGWKDEGGGLWSHDWPHAWGNFAYPWSVAKVLGHRREMLWAQSQPLRPVVLETYDVSGLAQFGGKEVKWSYTGFLDPRKTLGPGTFGVAEREENGRRIYVRLAVGARLPAEGIEAAMRPALLNLAGKSRVVLRGISFEKCANSDRDFGAQSPVSFGPSFEEASRPGDVLMEHCRFRWNSGVGFNLSGWRWTVRDCDFSYNGYSGLAASDASNVLFERVSANFNCWREALAGSEDWNYGGIKIHSTTGHLVRGFTAIGNATHGAWWDVHCGDVTFEDAVLIRNRRSFIYELSQGPFVARRVLAAHGFRSARMDNALNAASLVATSQRARIEDSLFYTDHAPEAVGFLWYERDDEHSRQKPLRAELFELRGSVIVGGPHVPTLLREGNVGDRKRESYRSFRYQGRDNVFFSLGKRRDVFAFADANYSAVKLGFEAWAARSEKGARWLNPQLRDPDSYDFRFTPGSPLAREAGRLPQYVMPAPLRAEMERFLTWISWKPTPPTSP